jgi:hypothetical protein
MHVHNHMLPNEYMDTNAAEAAGGLLRAETAVFKAFPTSKG